MSLSPLFDRPGDFIAGRFISPERPDGEIRIHSPADLADHVATHAFSAGHVEHAVAAARDALPTFRRLAPAERASILLRYRDRLRAHREEIALCIAREVGKPLWEARGEADAMAAKIDVTLGEGAAYTETRSVAGVGEIRYRPLGVVAVIGPFNFPGHLPNGQIVAALALGNTVVHKPSEKTPSTAVWIARCLDEAGLPAGVFNLVQGFGDAGRALSVHPGVDGVLFTGSAAVGRQIVADNATHPERLVALELGGKNASIVLDDCDVERSARAIAFAGYATAGQRCTSTSRVIATPGIADALCERLATLARGLHVGHPLDEHVFMGPLISEQARARLLSAQRRADAAGIEVLEPGGACELDAGPRGHYVRPALRRMPTAAVSVDEYATEELFGPDLCVYRAQDLDHAIALANRSPYGLAAAVFTRSTAAFEHAAAELRVGVLHHNQSSAGASGRLPFGGIGLSGNHRPAGILTGLACSYALGVLTAPPASGPAPSWPGMPEPDRAD